MALTRLVVPEQGFIGWKFSRSDWILSSRPNFFDDTRLVPDWEPGRRACRNHPGSNSQRACTSRHMTTLGNMLFATGLSHGSTGLLHAHSLSLLAYTAASRPA